MTDQVMKRYVAPFCLGTAVGTCLQTTMVFVVFSHFQGFSTKGDVDLLVGCSLALLVSLILIARTFVSVLRRRSWRFPSLTGAILGAAAIWLIAFLCRLFCPGTCSV
jgi:hypothetical protein